MTFGQYICLFVCLVSVCLFNFDCLFVCWVFDCLFVGWLLLLFLIFDAFLALKDFGGHLGYTLICGIS